MQIFHNSRYHSTLYTYNVVQIIQRSINHSTLNHSQWLQNHSVLYKSFSIEVIQRSVQVVQRDNNQPSLHLVMLSVLKLIQ